MHADQTKQMYEAIVATGLYAGVAIADVRRLVAGEPLVTSLVTTDLHMDLDADGDADSVQVELQVLAVTGSRLVFWGAYEEAGRDGEPAVLHTHSRVMPLSKVSDVRILTTVSNPAEFGPDDVPDDVRVIFVLESIDRVDVEMAGCGDEDCDAAHGYLGDVIHDALMFGESREAVGEQRLSQLLEVAGIVSGLISRS
jgi:hypothetical protein